MKKIIFTLITVIATALTLSSFKFAPEAKVIAIVNKADWCSICKAYAGRTVATFTENNTDNYFQFIVNDITNDDTRKASKPSIQKVGLVSPLQDAYGAGVLSFYDAKTKKLLAQVTVANSAEEVALTMKTVREKASK
jgi:hypothetical protein